MKAEIQAYNNVQTTVDREICDLAGLKRWLKKSEEIQWDYKNIVKRKGHLERLK